jgi:hypothetical protein
MVLRRRRLNFSIFVCGRYLRLGGAISRLTSAVIVVWRYLSLVAVHDLSHILSLVGWVTQAEIELVEVNYK